MANHEESNPLLPSAELNAKDDAKKVEKPSTDKLQVPDSGKVSAPMGWTAEGLPLSHGSVIGEPVMGRTPWNSSLCACLGQNDDFCSSDLEVCLLGSVAPCVLYGSNVERLGSARGLFANHCMCYTGLFMLGNSFFGWNCFAPWFSHNSRTAIRRKFNLETPGRQLISFFGWNCFAPWFSHNSRTAIRRKFNLEGSCEATVRACGCGGSYVEDEVQREQCEMACDFATHVLCHPCALCQEGREVRRRIPHPGFKAQQIMVMIPPNEQVMGRGA